MKLHLPLFAILATVTLAGCHSASAAQVAAEQMLSLIHISPPEVHRLSLPFPAKLCPC